MQKVKNKCIITAMKIAIDIRTAGGEKAGKGWYTFNIVQNLLKIDKKNEYLLYTNGKIVGFDGYKNATIKVISGKSIFWHLKVTRDILKEKINIFFAPSSYIIPAILPKKIKSIFTIHDLISFLFPDSHNKKANLIEKLFLKKAAKKATKILTVSKNTKEDVVKILKTDPRKINIISCAAGENFKPIKKESLVDFQKKTSLPKKYFLAVGTLIPRKNYINLIKAFILFQKKFDNFHIVIVGGNGWNYEGIYKIIRDNHLTKKIHILGYLSEKSLINLYNLAQALIFPSYYEGFGIPPLEAMKCGCPVIASNTSSIPEVVADAAITINPDSPEEIFNAMTKIIQNEKLKKTLIEKGFTNSSKFSWENSAKELLAIIKKMS
jgi:glycosyltransferase involved in cell wall biosynthesis